MKVKIIFCLSLEDEIQDLTQSLLRKRLANRSRHLFVSYTGLSEQGLGFQPPEHQVWYMLFIVFVPYAMLPLSLGWCILVGCLSSISHVLATAVDINDIVDREAVSQKVFLKALLCCVF